MLTCALLLLVPTFAPAQDGERNLLPNAGFEVDTDGDGMADDWTFSGNDSVKVTWSREEGVEGNYSQKLDCTGFDYTSASSHVMLSQVNGFALEAGEWYELTFQAKGERILGASAQVAMQKMGPWGNLGCNDAFRISPEWREVRTTFRATETISDNLRLQIWFGSTGTIWLDDMRLVKSAAPARRYGEVIPDLGSKNLIPNSSFECGTSGWGSITDTPGWGGNMTFLHGEIDRNAAAAHSSSMMIPIDRDTVPVYYFDYFEMSRAPVLKPLLANRGWISVEPGKEYTLSASIRSAPAGVPCVMKIYHAFAGQPAREVAAESDWERVSLTFTAQSTQLYITIGPDLAESTLDSATLWVDAVQLEQSATATEYEPRAPVEIGVEWAAPGHLFSAPGDVKATITAYNATPTRQSVQVAAEITDVFDQPAAELTVDADIPADSSVRKALRPRIDGKGFFRMALSAEGGALVPARPERFAVIDACRDEDGLFGMNHAYPWERLNRLSKDIGLTWFRDWSLKWPHVEPEQGKFDFTEPDHQISRVLDLGINILPLLPFPSSDWASTGPEPEDGSTYPGIRERATHMPADMDDFRNYVRTTVLRYRDQLKVWEILNEPIYTSYALPAAEGYTVEDYVTLLQAAYESVKGADPEALVIGGIAGHPGSLTEEFIRAGGLKWVDAINLHAYPGLQAPESFIEPLEKLNARMAAAGKRRPIWFTEGAYYADDDPPTEPYQSSWMTVMDSELEAAAYNMRFCIILIGHGARKIIYHSGTPGAVNNEGMAGIFFEWEGAPRKMSAAQSQLTWLLGPDTVSLGRLSEEPYAYAFHSRGKTVVALWTYASAQTRVSPTAAGQLLDIVGNRVRDAVTLGEAPHYLVYDEELPAGRLKQALRNIIVD